jgi:hypothetical protein
LLGEGVRILSGVEFIREWWEATEADIQHDPKRPNINSTGVFAMAGILEDLRGDI